MPHLGRVANFSPQSPSAQCHCAGRRLERGHPSEAQNVAGRQILAVKSNALSKEARDESC